MFGALMFSPIARFRPATATLARVGGVQAAFRLREKNFGAQHLLLLDHPALFQLLRHVEIVLGPANGVFCDPLEAPGPKYLVVREGDLVLDRLMRTVGLELRDVHAELRLPVAAHAPTEVRDEPLDPQLGQFVAGVQVQPDRDRAGEGQERKVRRARTDRNRRAAGAEVEAAGRVPRDRGREERGDRDRLCPLRLGDPFEEHAQPGLIPIRERNGVGQRERPRRLAVVGG